MTTITTATQKVGKPQNPQTQGVSATMTAAPKASLAGAAQLRAAGAQPPVNPQQPIGGSYTPPRPASLPTVNQNPDDEFKTLSAGGSVEQRTASILGKDSGLLQQARAQAQRAMSSRGLGNSSLAVDAGQRAVYDVAIPIAQQDAQAQNAFDMGRMQFGQQRLAAQDAYKYTSNLSSQDFGQQTALNEQQNKEQREQQIRQIQAQFGLSRQEAEQRLTENAQNFGFQTQLNEQQIAAQREEQIRQIEAQFGLSRQEAEQRLAENQQGFNFQTQLNEQQIGAQREQQIRDIESRFGLSRQEAEQQLAQLEADYAGRFGLQNLAGQQNLQEIQARTDAEARLQQLAATTQKELAQINQQGSITLAQMESDNRLLLQTSASAATRYSDLMQQVSAILQNTTMAQADKVTATNALIAYSQQAFNLQNALLQSSGLAQVPQAALPQFLGTTPTGAIANPATPPVAAPTPAPAPAPTPTPPRPGIPGRGGVAYPVSAPVTTTPGNIYSPGTPPTQQRETR